MSRSVQEIDADIAAARDALANAEGRECECYSRITGYYRSVKHWNKGKQAEYKQRRAYDVDVSMAHAGIKEAPAEVECESCKVAPAVETRSEQGCERVATATGASVMLFVRHGCPNCPPAIEAAERLHTGVDRVEVKTIDAGSAEGLEQARTWSVMSTPTAILIEDGVEVARANNGRDIWDWRYGVAQYYTQQHLKEMRDMRHSRGEHTDGGLTKL